MQNLKRFAATLASLIFAATAAHAAGVLDQQALPFGGSLYEGLEWQQQVTAGLTGRLTGITLYGNGTDLTVRIAKGDVASPAPFAFSSLAHLSPAGTFIDTSAAGILLTAGDKFVIDTTAGSNGNISVAAGPYAGGHLYLNFGAPSDFTSCCGFSAMAFQTYVDGPAAGTVPEPAAWALMIVGFGGAGLMLRRRPGDAVAA
ncbi:MAG TPA: PEPxxWA-CTERM sorting domain-containing protein [Phenylobacterium sp.]|nr:PEPxxWA-CTERM sorting domain-containing protein [Phenylobacterium sp.]